MIEIGLIEGAALLVGTGTFGAGITALIVGAPKGKPRTRKAYRRARLTEQLLITEPEPFDPTGDEPTEETPAAMPGSLRYALGSGVTDLGVRFRQMRRTFRDETAILNAAAGEIQAISFRPTASIFADPVEHFTSEHIDAELAAILDNPSWAKVTNTALLEELMKRQPGMPTGQYPMVASHPDNPDQIGGGDPTIPRADGRPADPWRPVNPNPTPGAPPPPKLVGQPRVPADVIHAIHGAPVRAGA